MKIKIWGAQGSLPTPLRPDTIKEKIIQAILEMPDLDSRNPDAVRAYVDSLPPLLSGTAKGNTSCVEIQTGNEIFIIDAGTGIRELGNALMRGPCGRGQGKIHIFFSHCHWDHIQGFPFFVPAFIPGNHITIYSIHDVAFALTEQQRYLFFPVAFNAAQAERELAQLDDAVRQRYGVVAAMQAQREFVRLTEGQSFSVGPLKINTSRNYHPGDAYGYRFEDQHSVFVYGGDAEYKNLDADTFQERVDLFRDADAVLFDAQYGLRDAWESKVDFGHSSAMIGVDFARRAGAKRLLLTHHEPTYSDQKLQEIQQTATAYQAQDPTLPTCEVIIAYEGLEIDLAPARAIAVHASSDDEAVVFTPGRIFDEQGVARLLDQLTNLAQSATPFGSIVDLSQVERLTTASLKTLVTFGKQHQESRLILAAPSATVQEVIKLGGYADYFAIYPTVDEAAKAVQARDTLNLPGQLINNRYQIVDNLGQNAVGTVLKVVDQTNQHEVALRVLSPAFEADTVDRLISQMQPLLNLVHPQMAQIYDCAWNQTDNYTFVVETLLTGATLFERLNQQAKPLPPDEALNLAFDLTQTLEYAHNRGVIHGNLKPQDIFFTAAGVKISGFGLARLQEGQSLQNAPLLYVRATHVSPEQILGQPLDARTDLYALGVILYQVFTGQLPFTGSDNAVMQAHLEQAPRPPRHLNPHLSHSVEHLILKLLAKNPNERYASAKQTRQISINLMFNNGETRQSVKQQFVGRTVQLQTLQAAWQEAKTGHGQLVFITGEPGIGKTSLIQQLAAQSQAMLVLTGHCQEQEGQPAYLPFVELLQTFIATVPPELSEPEMRHWVSHFSHLVPSLKQSLPDLPEPPPLEPKYAQLRLISNMTQFIKRATESRPWLLILDDLHWVDEASVELLCYLGRHLSEMALMIVGTYRKAEIGRNHPLQKALRTLGQTPICRHVALDRLNQTDMAELLHQLWSPDTPDTLINTIYQHTGGNPLYAEEIARALMDDGSVKVQSGVWHFPPPSRVQLPQTIFDAIKSRIHYLDTATRATLSHAAVLGHIFRFSDVVMMSQQSERTVLDHLDAALERQLVQEIGGDELIRFRHAEIHHVIYSDLGLLRRRRLHQRAAELIEQRAQTESNSFADELAHHFSQAGEWKRALDYSFKAANQAKQSYANETALQWYERTLEMLDQLHADVAASFQSLRLSALQSMGQLLTLAGRYDEALSQYSTAQTLLQSDTTFPNAARLLADLHRLTAQVYDRKGDYEIAIGWIETALSYLDKTEKTIELAMIYRVGTFLHVRQDKLDAAIRWAEKGIAVASHLNTVEGQLALSEIYNQMGLIFKRRGEYDQAENYLQTSVTICQQINRPDGLLAPYNNLGLTHLELGNWTQARNFFTQALQISQKIGDVLFQGLVNANIGFLDLQRGDLNQAMALFQQSLNIWRESGNQWDEANTLSNIAHVHLAQANWPHARQALERSQAIFSEIKSDEMIPEIERHWATLYLKTAEFDLALEHITRSIDVALKLGSQMEEGLSRRVFGQIHQARHEPKLAEIQFRHSLQILNDIDNKYHLAKTKLAFTSLLIDQGDWAEAQTYLHEAIETFEQLEAKADLAEARQLAQRIKPDTPLD